MNEQFLVWIIGVLSSNQKGCLVLFTKHVEFGESLSGDIKGI